MENTADHGTQPSGNSAIFKPLVPWAQYLGLATSCLAIYGYCVMQGIGDALHIEGGSLWGSPADVLHYAFLGIVSLFIRLPDTIGLTLLQTIMTQWPYWVYSVVIAICTWMFLRTDNSAEAIAERKTKWKSNRLAQWMQKPFKGIPRYQLAVVASTPLVIPAVLVGTWFVLVSVLAGLAIFGLLGINSGLAHVADHHPANPYCVTAPTPQDPTAKAVRCVRVRWQVDGQTHSETGILITSTSSYALLVKPKIPNGLRVPLSGQAILEAVSQLEAAPHMPEGP